MQVSNDELSASDGRVLDAFVDDKKSEFTAFENEFSRDLDSVQESINARLEGELAEMQGSVMDKIDAAVEALRAENRRDDADEETVAKPAAASDGLEARLPANALVVVVGGATALGRSLIDSLSGSSWRVRALLPDGTAAAMPEGVETAPFAAFSPTALKKSMDGADAIVLVTAAAAGAGGVEAEAIPRLMQVPHGFTVVTYGYIYG